MSRSENATRRYPKIYPPDSGKHDAGNGAIELRYIDKYYSIRKMKKENTRLLQCEAENLTMLSYFVAYIGGLL